MGHYVEIEGYTIDEILEFTDSQLQDFVFVDTPITFKAGTAEILGQFYLQSDRLVVELAQIDGGGEGVLPTIWVLSERYASERGLQTIEWVVHAINCAKPNTKLRRVLHRMGFEIKNHSQFGEVYHLLREIST